MRLTLDLEEQTITLDGVAIDLNVLRAIATPDASHYYQFVREDRADPDEKGKMIPVVTVQSFAFPQYRLPEGAKVQ